MTTRKRPLKPLEIQTALSSAKTEFPAILSPTLLGKMIGISRKTIYEWLAKGRLDGAFRRRGKRVLIWRDRAIEILFNGPDWRNDAQA
jgi:predicted DNA-binding transcriptional regulator AlpA